MLNIPDLLWGLALPAAVCGSLLALTFFCCKSAGPLAGDSIGVVSRVVPALLCLGFLIGATALHGIPKLPPGQAAQWLYWSAAAMGLLTAMQIFVLPKSRFWTVAQCLLMALSIVGITKPLFVNSWSMTESTVRIGGYLGAAVLLFISLVAYGNRTSNRAMAGTLAMVGFLTAVVLGMSGSQVLALDAAIFPTVLTTMILLAALWKNPLNAAAIATVYVLLVGGLILCGNSYSELTPINALLLFFAPLAMWIGRLPKVKRLRQWQQVAIQLLATLIPAGLAFGLALRKFIADMADFPAY